MRINRRNNKNMVRRRFPKPRNPRHLPPSSGNRIINGTEVSPACGSNNNPNDDYGCKYPFMVHIESINNNELRCGGSLIHPEWVLTAAHCMDNAEGHKWSDPNNSKVRLGVHNQFNINSEWWTEAINVDFIIQHPDWNSNRLNDIALLHLETPSTFTPISLVSPPAGGFFDYPQDVTLLGWGITDEIAPGSNVGSQSDVLMELETIYHPPDECILTDSGFNYYHGDRMMCIGDEIDGNAIDSACFGDSGGPAIMYNAQTNRDEVVGVISWGSPWCASSWGDETHSVSTRVEYYLPWIYNIIDSWTGEPEEPTSFLIQIHDICSSNGNWNYLANAPYGPIEGIEDDITFNQIEITGGACTTFDNVFEPTFGGGSEYLTFVENSEWCRNVAYDDFVAYCEDDYHVWCFDRAAFPDANGTPTIFFSPNEIIPGSGWPNWSQQYLDEVIRGIRNYPGGAWNTFVSCNPFTYHIESNHWTDGYP